MTSSDTILTGADNALLPLVDEILTSAERVADGPGAEIITFCRLLLGILQDKSRSVDLQPLLSGMQSSNGTLCFSLGILAKARGARKVSKVLLNKSLQIEYSNGNLTQCAYVAVELIGLSRNSEETVEAVNAALDLINHEKNSCEVDIEVQTYIADLLWNLGVDSALLHQHEQAKEQLVKAMQIYSSCASTDPGTKRKHHKLNQAYNTWLQSINQSSAVP